MKEERIFIEPKLEIILFDPAMDVIATSGDSINCSPRTLRQSSSGYEMPWDLF